jgi:ABC-type transport system involved in multi-copper enzyme maturation permease subunit
MLLVTLLFVGSAIVATSLTWSALFPPGEPLVIDAEEAIAGLIAAASTPLLWFLQWAVGLRAAGVVSVERQRHTWDALLVSPLEGREIVWAKTWGSLYALRWLLAATAVAWICAAMGGTLAPDELASLLGLLLCAGAFMAAVGVAVSLRMTNPTRGMATTIGLWMLSAIGTAVLAGLIALVASLLISMLWMSFQLTSNGANMTATAWMPNFGEIIAVAYVVLRLAIYLILTVAIAATVTLRFDRLAGRMSAPLDISL